MLEQGKGERIVVGVDGSANGRAALRWTISHARAGDTVCLVHAWCASPAVVEAGLARPDDDTAAKACLRHEASRARDLGPRPGVEITTSAVHGDPRPALLEAARAADLLVIGARGHSGVAGLLMGSACSYLTRHAQCPTVVVPCPGVGQGHGSGTSLTHDEEEA
jgi:nucleotide-binding universal stress UspA family protein